MKIISFAWTTKALCDGEKDMSRRDWKDSHAKRFKNGEIVAAYDKLPHHGGKKVAEIMLTKNPYRQRLKDMPESDLKREGGLWKSKEEFIDLFGGDPNKNPYVVEFKKVKNCGCRTEE